MPKKASHLQLLKFQRRPSRVVTSIEPALQDAFDDLAYMHGHMTAVEFAPIALLLAGCASKMERVVEERGKR
jgi:hypothetical protein